ncbi:glycoside hydrolase family 31 protein [Luteococcus sanguinis]|uniref:TIM-barrel domain-containing protein n=1 Tax=Luteococcus sanguinis TaxID=174038 RepID=A0ABW1X508_9ACTN
MPQLPERFHLAITPKAAPDAVLVFDTVRLTFLTDRLVRVEHSPSGNFEDRATQMVLNRRFGVPPLTVNRRGEGVQVLTGAIQLDYAGGEPTPATLSIKTLSGSYHSVWRPGEDPTSDFASHVNLRNNLGGTVRTLDTIDGATPLEPGLLNELGIASLPDDTLPMTDDGWFEPRLDGYSDTYVFAYGHDFADAVADFYRLTGPQPVLPRYALGNWWSRYHDYTQDEYQALIERFEAEDLPFSVAVVDMDWHLVDIPERFGNGWTGYTWNPELFPDHVGFLRWLHEHGMKIALNVHPADGIRAHEEAYRRVAEAMGIDPASELPVNFDIADPDFLANYLELVHHPLEDEGVDFWWLDWQQGGHSSIPGLDPLWLLNHFHFLDNARTGRRPLTFSRYAGPGSHRYPVGFSGDSVISWSSLAFQPYMTATASNIGYGWWSHDIGGHMFGTKDDELATRWLQFGVFSPVTRLHSTKARFSGKEPWRFDAIAEQVMGRFLRFRHRMVPYLYTMNELGNRTLSPLLRPMYWSHGDQWEAFQVDNQYWFGTELVVAAITEPNDPRLNAGRVKAWLPRGTWTDIFTGLVYTGDKFVELHRGLGQYPVLAKAGAIVPLTGEDDLRVENPASLEIRVFAGDAGEFVLYEDDDAVDARAARTRFTLDWAGGRFTIHPAEGNLDVVPATRDYRVVLFGAAPAAVQGHESVWDESTGSQEIDLGPVNTRTGAEIVFTEPLTLHDNQVPARVAAFLDQAEIEFLTKDRVMAIVDANPASARRLVKIAELGLDERLESALRELIAAHE